MNVNSKLLTPKFYMYLPRIGPKGGLYQGIE